MDPTKVGSCTPRRRAAPSEQTIRRIMDDVRRIFRRVDSLSRRAERVTGLTSPQLWALKVLRETGCGDVPTLARRMRLHPATLGKVLEGLVEKGFVKWRRPRRAGGEPRVALTGEGEYFGSRAPAVPQGLLLDGLRRLSPEGLASVGSGVQRLVHMLGARNFPAQLLFSDEVNLRPGESGSRTRKATGDEATHLTAPAASRLVRVQTSR